MAKKYREPLFIDIAPQLAQVDKGFTGLLKDREQWEEFLEDPVGVMGNLGIIDRVPRNQLGRANAIFYRCLANKELVSFIVNMYEDFESDVSQEAKQVHEDGLKRGAIENLPEHEFDAIDDLIRHPGALSHVFTLTMNDLNENNLFAKRYEEDEISRFVAESVAAIKARRALPDLPSLPGEEPPFAQPLQAVVGPIAVAVVGAQAGAAFTVYVAALSNRTGSFAGLLKSAYAGDADSTRALSLLGRLFDLTSELTVHAQRLDEAKG